MNRSGIVGFEILQYVIKPLSTFTASNKSGEMQIQSKFNSKQTCFLRCLRPSGRQVPSPSPVLSTCCISAWRDVDRGSAYRRVRYCCDMAANIGSEGRGSRLATLGSDEAWVTNSNSKTAKTLRPAT